MFVIFDLLISEGYLGPCQEKLSTIFGEQSIVIDAWQGFDALSANPTKSSNTLKTILDKSRRIVLGVFDHFVGLALKRWNTPFVLILNNLSLNLFVVVLSGIEKWSNISRWTWLNI